MDQSQKHDVESKIPDINSMYLMVPFILDSKVGNTSPSVVSQNLGSLGREEWLEGTQGSFWGSGV